MQQFFENKSAKVYYDPALDALVLEYTNKVLNHEQFVTINTAARDAFQKSKTRKFIADIRKMGVISIESQKWIVDNLIPAMIKHLNGKNPIIVQLMDDSDVFAKTAANNIKKKAENDIGVTQFTDRVKMEAYLKSV